MTKSNVDLHFTEDNNNIFREAFFSFNNVPSELILSQIESKKSINYTLKIFNLLGYFHPNKLWNDMHLFGIKKGETNSLFNHPHLVFAQIYKAYNLAIQSEDSQFNADIFINNIFNRTDHELKYLFGHDNIMERYPVLNDQSEHELNNLVIKNLILYWYQNAFNRKHGKEMLHLIVSEESQNSNNISKFQQLNDAFKSLGFINARDAKEITYDYIFITGSSYEGMNMTFENATNNILPGISSTNLFVQTGARNMSIIDGSVFAPSQEARIEYAKHAILTIAAFKGIELNPEKPINEIYNDNILVNLSPNFLHSQNENSLTETDIARYFVYDKYKECFDNFKVNIIDTQNEEGESRPTTFTTAVQSFLNIIGDILASDLTADEIQNIKILIITVGAPFIQRQGIDELLALNTTIDKLTDIVTAYSFNNKQELGKAILKSLELNIPTSKMLNTISEFKQTNTDSNEDLVYLLKSIKNHITIEPVGDGIESLNYNNLISMIVSEFGAKAYAEYLLHNRDTVIPVGYRVRENDEQLIPQYPTFEEINNYLSEIENLDSLGQLTFVTNSSYEEING